MLVNTLPSAPLATPMGGLQYSVNAAKSKKPKLIWPELRFRPQMSDGTAKPLPVSPNSPALLMMVTPSATL